MDIIRKEPQHGWIEVIAGSMFSGKSEELIRRLRRAQIARQKVQIFKPLVDDRFSEDHIVSHSDMRIPSEAVKTSDELLGAGGRGHRGRRHRRRSVLRRRICRPACNTLADRGKRVIVAGLDQDYLRPSVRADAAAAGDRGVHHQDARHLRGLWRSGQPYAAARAQQRPRAGRRRGLYEARCRHCFDPHLAAAAKID